MTEVEKPKSDYAAMRLANKWKEAKFESQVRHKDLMAKINVASLAITIGLASYTYMEISNGFENCEGAWVSTTLLFVLAMHFTNIL